MLFRSLFSVVPSFLSWFWGSALRVSCVVRGLSVLGLGGVSCGLGFGVLLVCFGVLLVFWSSGETGFAPRFFGSGGRSVVLGRDRFLVVPRRCLFFCQAEFGVALEDRWGPRPIPRLEMVLGDDLLNGIRESPRLRGPGQTLLQGPSLQLYLPRG